MRKKLAAALAGVSLSLTLLAGRAEAAHLSDLTAEDCKNGGFAEYQRVRGDMSTTFKNQGDCIQFVNTGK